MKRSVPPSPVGPAAPKTPVTTLVLGDTRAAQVGGSSSSSAPPPSSHPTALVASADGTVDAGGASREVLAHGGARARRAFGPRSDERKCRFRTRVREMRRRLAFKAWISPVDLEPWRKRARTALDALCAPIPAPPEADPDWAEKLDLCTDAVRLRTVEEEVEASIRQRLESLSTAIEDEFAEEESKPSAQEPCRRRLRGKGSPTLGAKNAVASDAAPAAAAAAAASAEPEPPSPLRTYDDVMLEREALIRTASGELARGARRDDGASKASCSSQARTSPFVVANRGVNLHVYSTALQGNVHRRALERLLGVVDKQDADVEVDLRMPELQELPATLPQVDPAETIITVAVCNSAGHKEQQFDVLASQKLYELRDALHFASDWMFDGPTRGKSACFFVGGVFYNDRRHPTSIDYSKEFIEWMQQTRGENVLPPNPSRSMDVSFAEIAAPLPIGARCTYIHQGDLEHSVYFTGARLYDPQRDCPAREAYPILTFMRRYTKKSCYCCWQNAAVWLVLNSKRCPHNPSYWCGQCFDGFYKDKEGNLLKPIDYKMFPYLHDDF